MNSAIIYIQIELLQPKEVSLSQYPLFTTLVCFSMRYCRCFFHLCHLHSVCWQPGCDITAKLVSALVLLHLDYCNTVLSGLPDLTLAPLQRVLHMTVRMVLKLKPSHHQTPALHKLQPIARIDYKLCLLVQGPRYMGQKPTTARFLAPTSGSSAMQIWFWFCLVLDSGID